MNIDEAIEKRFLIRIKGDKKLVEKELKEANYDFDKAEKTFRDEDYKWSIVKSYYTIFHAARAVLFNLGYREKRHFAIGVVLEDLNKQGKLESRFVNDFNAAIQSREDADYHYIYSKEAAENSLLIAEDFVHKMKELLSDEKNKIALFIGRFQPFHLGHLRDIKEVSSEVNKVIIAIGSSQESGTEENPYSFEQRKEMIENTLEKENVSNYEIKAVSDINDDEEWVGHVISIIGKIDFVLTGNEKTKRLFEEKEYDVKKVNFLEGINGTKIRDLLKKDKDWKHLVHEEVHKLIKD